MRSRYRLNSDGTTLVNDVPEDLVAHADAGLLRRVLQNLIANAIEHTPRGEVVVSACAVEGRIECSIRDSGEGIPADRLHKVFEPFETDANKQGGVGWGSRS